MDQPRRQPHATRLVRPVDTTEEAFAVQTSILSQMTDAQRLTICRQLSERAKAMAMVEIRHRHPEYSDQQVHLALIRLLVGDDLFRQAYPDADVTP